MEKVYCCDCLYFRYNSQKNVPERFRSQTDKEECRHPSNTKDDVITYFKATVYYDKLPSELNCSNNCPNIYTESDRMLRAMGPHDQVSKESNLPTNYPLPPMPPPKRKLTDGLNTSIQFIWQKLNPFKRLKQ